MTTTKTDPIVEMEQAIEQLLERRTHVLAHKKKALEDFDARDAELMRRVDDLRTRRHEMVRERDAHLAREKAGGAGQVAAQPPQRLG